MCAFSFFLCLTSEEQWHRTIFVSAFYFLIFHIFLFYLAVRTKMVYCKIDQTQQKVVVRYIFPKSVTKSNLSGIRSKYGLALLTFFQLFQPQYTPHLWQATVAATVWHFIFLESQPCNSQDQSARLVTFCLISFPNYTTWCSIAFQMFRLNDQVFIFQLIKEPWTILIFVELFVLS